MWGILHYTELALLYFLYKESWMVAMDPIYEDKDHVAKKPSFHGRIEQTSASLSQRSLRAYLEHRYESVAPCRAFAAHAKEIEPLELPDLA